MRGNLEKEIGVVREKERRNREEEEEAQCFLKFWGRPTPVFL